MSDFFSIFVPAVVLGLALLLAAMVFLFFPFIGIERLIVYIIKKQSASEESVLVNLRRISLYSFLGTALFGGIYILLGAAIKKLEWLGAIGGMIAVYGSWNLISAIQNRGQFEKEVHKYPCPYCQQDLKLSQIVTSGIFKCWYCGGELMMINDGRWGVLCPYSPPKGRRADSVADGPYEPWPPAPKQVEPKTTEN